MTEFYRLQKVAIPEPAPGEFRIATACVWSCALCGGMIDGMGGPGDGQICVPCGDQILDSDWRGISECYR